MEVQLTTQSDSNFTINLNSSQKNVLEENVVSIGTVEEPETIVEAVVEQPPQFQPNGPRPAPVGNNQGLSWFAGTSWGN